MKEMRGKLVLLSNVYSLHAYGISYSSLNIQDNYYLRTNWDLYNKWERIKAQINRSNAKTNNTIYMNYLSGSGGVFPYFVASGHSSPQTSAPRLSTALTEPGFKSYYPDFPRAARIGVFATIYFEGTNTLTANYLSSKKVSYCGIVMADFPGMRLIDNIIACNLR
jgi:1-phosphatidylinositol phosphodiesterase